MTKRMVCGAAPPRDRHPANGAGLPHCRHLQEASHRFPPPGKFTGAVKSGWDIKQPLQKHQPSLARQKRVTRKPRPPPCPSSSPAQKLSRAFTEPRSIRGGSGAALFPDLVYLEGLTGGCIAPFLARQNGHSPMPRPKNKGFL